MSTIYRALVRRDTYRDSVELMRVAAQLEQVPGVTRAALLLGGVIYGLSRGAAPAETPAEEEATP
jgi:hypothetical protein